MSDSTKSYPYFYNPKLADIINYKINQKIIYFASLYILKKMSVPEEDGGITFHAISLNDNQDYLEPIINYLYEKDYIFINTKTQAYELSEKGFNYVENLIDEIEGYIDEYSQYEDIQERLEAIQNNQLDPLLIRFLWGLYDGEFDDLVEWQNKNKKLKINSPSNDWKMLITSADFYENLYYNMSSKSMPIERIFFYNLEHPDFQ